MDIYRNDIISHIKEIGHKILIILDPVINMRRNATAVLLNNIWTKYWLYGRNGGPYKGFKIKPSTLGAFTDGGFTFS